MWIHRNWPAVDQWAINACDTYPCNKCKHKPEKGYIKGTVRKSRGGVYFIPSISTCLELPHFMCIFEPITVVSKEKMIQEGE